MMFIFIPLINEWEKALKEAQQAGAVKIGYDEEGEQE